MPQTAGSKGFGKRVAQERRLKAARDHRDIGKQDVAAAIGVSNSTYGRWEDGTLPDDERLERLAKYFGVTPAWLRYGQEPRAPFLYDTETPEVEEAASPVVRVAGAGAGRAPRADSGTARGSSLKAKGAGRPRRRDDR